MTYWDLVLKEILNKHKTTATFRFTHRKNRPDEKYKKTSARAKARREKREKTYALGAKYPNVVFTYQESECMKQAIKGKTIPKIAETLKLSPRTVEFYFSKMREKMCCRSKSELIEKVIESDFLKNAGVEELK